MSSMRNALFNEKDVPAEMRRYFEEIEVECGSPWERVVEKEWGAGKGKPYDGKRPDGLVFEGRDRECKSKTIGWQPTCKCNAETEPCTVLDPFFGSGTTGIVSYKHGRKFIGIELSETYLDEIAIPRIEKETQQMRLFN